MSLPRAVALVAVIAMPVLAHAEEPAPAAEAGFHLESHRMTGFFWVGGLLLAMGNAGGWIVAANAGFDHGSAWMAVPIIGPYIGAVKARDLHNCGAFTPPPAVLAPCNAPIELDGLVALAVVQMLGAALLPFGMLHRHTLVPTLSVAGGPRLGISGEF
jgi:hypothetical protein